MQAIDDYINGNLSDAKMRARRAGRRRVQQALQTEYGHGAASTLAILNYLFDGGSFQAACDAEAAEKEKAA